MIELPTDSVPSAEHERCGTPPNALVAVNQYWLARRPPFMYYFDELPLQLYRLAKAGA